MNRRQFVVSLLAGGAVMGAGGAAWLANGPDRQTLTVDATVSLLDELIKQPVKTLGAWNLTTILTHCAQSVEYSMTGYPDHKSDTFKATAGQLAFSVFSTRGEMRHALNEAIPGAPMIETRAAVQEAYQRFRTSLLVFQAYQALLKDHFAYGPLSKSQYEVAHAMHFYNHLLEIEPIA